MAQLEIKEQPLAIIPFRWLELHYYDEKDKHDNYENGIIYQYSTFFILEGSLRTNWGSRFEKQIFSNGFYGYTMSITEDMEPTEELE